MASTILDLLFIGRQSLKKITRNYNQESIWILSKVMSISSAELLLNNLSVSEKKRSSFIKLIDRRLNKEPLQYILENIYFYNYQFKINTNVFIPRQETEICIEILKKNDKIYNHALEIGCGLGCIAITLELERICKRIDSIDINNCAIKAAKENAENLGCKNIDFINQNFFSMSFKYKYDLIISNPPYIAMSEIEDLDQEVKLYDPLQALTDYSDGLKFYKYLAIYGKNFLNKDGIICLEFGGKNQQASIIKIFENNGFNTEIFLDLNKEPRFIVAS